MTQITFDNVAKNANTQNKTSKASTWSKVGRAVRKITRFSLEYVRDAFAIPCAIFLWVTFIVQTAWQIFMLLIGAAVIWFWVSRFIWILQIIWEKNVMN